MLRLIWRYKIKLFTENAYVKFCSGLDIHQITYDFGVGRESFEKIMKLIFAIAVPIMPWL
jgi:hypothetical protein